MDRKDAIATSYTVLSPQKAPPPSTAWKPLRCDICNSQDVRLVSGGKYRCLTCGFLPS